MRWEKVKNTQVLAGRRGPAGAVRSSAASLCGAALIIAQTGSASCQEQTTATYDDWTLQCEVKPGPPRQKSCAIWQLAQVQGRPFSRVEIGRPVQGQPMWLVAQVPVNVSLLGGMRLKTGTADPVLRTNFNRCVPAGCFAEFELSADTLKKFRSGGAGAKLTFRNAAGQQVGIPVSFKGFAPAFEALAKE